MKFDKKMIEYLEPVEIFKPEMIEGLELTGIEQDSRKVLPGNIFVCIEGEKSDGHNYMRQASESGAELIISKRMPENTSCPHMPPFIIVRDTQLALARLSAMFYNFPTKEVDLIGVTGTNGKTTVTHLVETIFEKAEINCALIGTLGSRFSSSEDYASTDHTTPQAPQLQENLRTIVDKGIKKVVMEVSSHSLDQYRVEECEFSGAVFTNITQDHLDYHITMENYFKAKTKLLSLLKKQPEQKKYAIINTDDPFLSRLPELMPKDIAEIKILTYGIENKADVMAQNIVFSVNGSEFLCVTPYGNRTVKLHLTGLFNIYNVLTAISVGIAEGIDLDTCISAVESVLGVPGRFEVVSREPLVIVDYAHTPNGLENVLNAARGVLPEQGKLICLFGCGGDRDVTKRPKMGKIAEDLCEKIIITSDNPRTEDPQQIITDILSGIKELNSKKIIVEPDRAAAIKIALGSASPNDVVVLAGKGHEDYQIVGNEKHHFDDREEARKFLLKA